MKLTRRSFLAICGISPVAASVVDIFPESVDKPEVIDEPEEFTLIVDGVNLSDHVTHMELTMGTGVFGEEKTLKKHELDVHFQRHEDVDKVVFSAIGKIVRVKIKQNVSSLCHYEANYYLSSYAQLGWDDVFRARFVGSGEVCLVSK